MSSIRPDRQRHACGPAGARSAPKAPRQRSKEPAALARDEGGCKLSNLRDSDKDRVARLVTTLAQQKKRAETEQRAREKAESSAVRAVAEAERAKETLRRSLELLNRYHQRAKADLAERARLKACVAVSAPHPVKEVAREATTSSSSPARGGHEGPLPSRSDATCGHPPYDDTPPSSR
ncbi:hypothetical protein FOZ63_013691, partial [Perkinsus olseni]